MIRVGPAGVLNPGAGTLWDEKGRSKISHIFVSWGEYRISSFQFGSVEDGVIVLSKQYGNFSPQRYQVVKLKHPSEFITGLSGEYSEIGGIASLTFHTNQRTHGPFNASGKTCGTRRVFSWKMGDGDEFGGFFGSSCYGLSSIGFYFTPKLTTTGYKEMVKEENA